ncbi:MAG TPA: ABC transporter substrate-binding protein [Corynebacteriales bacterium]|nr:ABC transporter substrate-binding protein [Mycobacteriales bacterium]
MPNNTAQKRKKHWSTAALALVTTGALVFSGCAGPNHNGAGNDLPLAQGPRSAVLPNNDPDVIIDKPVQNLPVTVEGADGEEVTVKDTSRIIGIDRPGTITRIVYALGLGDNLVGRDKTADFPAAQNIPLVTTKAHVLNAEKIIAARPSVVIVDYSVGPGAVIHQLRDIGIPVVYIDAERSISLIPTLINQVGKALGVKQEQIDKVVKSTQEEVEQATKRAQAMSDNRRIAVLVIRGSNVAFIGGPGSGADELVTALGGVDVSKEVGLTQDFTPMTPEAMVKAAPDTVIVMADGMKSAGGVDGIVSAPGMAQTPAGKNRSVVDVLDSALFSFGPGVGALIDALADALYGKPQEK